MKLSGAVGQTYYIFALSYLDLGLDQILRTAGATRPDNHPCFVSGTPRLASTKPEVRVRYFDAVKDVVLNTRGLTT